jgi:hypothetical protein
VFLLSEKKIIFFEKNGVFDWDSRDLREQWNADNTDFAGFFADFFERTNLLR